MDDGEGGGYYESNNPAGRLVVGDAGTGTFNQHGGSLTLTGSPTASSELILGSQTGSSGAYTQTGGTLNATSGLTNQGTYTMAGGTLTGGTLSNGTSTDSSGTFDGYGTITATNFSNYGTMTLQGGTSTVNGTFDNQGSGSLYIHDQSTFTGDVTNWGYIKVYGSSMIKAGTYTEYGTYESDPTTTTLEKLIIASTGALKGGVGDKWVISGDFINHSTQNLT